LGGEEYREKGVDKWVYAIFWVSFGDIYSRKTLSIREDICGLPQMDYTTPTFVVSARVALIPNFKRSQVGSLK
jgi:hypothetical protein